MNNKRGENFKTAARHDDDGDEELLQEEENNDGLVDALSSAKGRSAGETIAGVLGTIADMYDFGLFGYFSDVIGKVFFPPEQGHNALIQSLCILGSAQLVRPIGSLLFGKVGDTYGRKVALMSSILLMAGATFAVGCLPTYKAIGLPAIILLLLARLLQGISLGGQFTTAVLFTMEGKPTNTWALRGAIASAAGFGGMLLGSFVGYSTRQAFSQKELEEWGWRLPFLMGILVGLPGLYLKCHQDDSDIDTKIRELQETRTPVEILLDSKHRRSFISALFIPIVSSISLSLPFVWAPLLMKTLRTRHPIKQAYLINSVAMLISIIINLLVGIVSDKYFKRTQLMFAGGTCLVTLSPLMMLLIGEGTPFQAFCAQISMSLCFSLWTIPMYAWLAQSFPPNIRLSGLSIGFNVAFAIGGGFAPALATMLFEKFGSASPGFFISGLACLSMIALLGAPPIIDHRKIDDTKKPSVAVPVDYYERKELLSYRQVTD